MPYLHPVCLSDVGISFHLRGNSIFSVERKKGRKEGEGRKEGREGGTVGRDGREGWQGGMAGRAGREGRDGER